MKKILYACFAALMLFAATGFTRAQIVLSFTDLYGDQYGKYVPFYAKLTSGGVEQQNFELYYALGGATPSRDAYLNDPEGIIKVVATNGVAEIILSLPSAPYFQAVAYPANDTRASNVVSKTLTALDVEAPSFNPPAPRFGKTPVAPNAVVRIVDEAGGSEIYYSTDGETEPIKALFGKNPNVFKYDDAVGIKITKDVNIRAIAFKRINGNEGGSDMVRGGFEIDNKPQVQLVLAENNREWTIGQAAPVLTVNTLNGATLGTSANDVAVKLNFTITGATWTQIITASGTPLDMAKAVQAAQEDYCQINCSLVKGNSQNTAVNNIPVTPEVLGFQIAVPGEKPATPVFSIPGNSTVLKGTEVALTCTTEGADIYYNINNDEEPRVKYTKPIVINSNSVIKAMARKDGKSSDMVQSVYTVTENEDEVVTAPGAPTFSVTSGKVDKGTVVYLECGTSGAEIRYTVDGSTPSASSALYDGNGITINGDLTLKAIAIKGALSSTISIAAYTVDEDSETPENPDPIPGTVETPTFSPAAGMVNAGTVVYLECGTSGAEIRYTIDGSTPTASSTLYTTGITINEALTVKAIAIKNGQSSAVAEAAYTIKGDEPTGEKIELWFNPVSGSEVNEGREVTIIASKPYITEIFYMMFSSEAEARATAWDQDAARPFDVEMKPALTSTENTIKAAYARPGNTAIDNVFFYATYTVRKMSNITLTFNPTSGSEVENGTTVTVAASHDLEIFYNVYADKAAADADPSFVYDSKTVGEHGMPVITKEAPFLRCGVFDNAKMLYFDAVYTIKDETPSDSEKIELTFNPASGSEVKDGTVVTVTANRDADIYYNVYADKSAADADGSFILTAYMVADGMPIITQGKPFLRCGVFDGKMVYFDAAYTVKKAGTSSDTTAVETEFERTVSVYPNPGDGVFNIKVPVASTVEIFAANGVLFRHLNLNAGVTTVKIDRSGIYFLRIAGGGHIAIKRIIVR